MKVDWTKIEHFKPEEFRCPCCGKEEMEHSFVAKLDNLRIVLEKPLKISAGWRCAKHNEAIGGALVSPHLIGIAVDISAHNARLKRKIVNKAVALGFMGIGVYNGHIHLDESNRWHGEPVIWPGISK